MSERSSKQPPSRSAEGAGGLPLSSEVAEQQASHHSAARRRLLKGIVGTAPVLMTVASRPALASRCTVSGTLSGNLSKADDYQKCVGLTPGYWGQHPYDWPSPYFAGKCRDGGHHHKTGKHRDGGHHHKTGKHCKFNEYDSKGTPFHAGYMNELGQSGPFDGDLYGDMTMMEVIQAAGNNDRYQLGAHAAASILNAATFDPESFGYTEGEIVDMWADGYLTDPEGLKEAFQLLNERADYDDYQKSSDNDWGDWSWWRR